MGVVGAFLFVCACRANLSKSKSCIIPRSPHRSGERSDLEVSSRHKVENLNPRLDLDPDADPDLEVSVVV